MKNSPNPDKDRFDKDMYNVGKGYYQILKRLLGEYEIKSDIGGLERGALPDCCLIKS